MPTISVVLLEYTSPACFATNGYAMCFDTQLYQGICLGSTRRLKEGNREDGTQNLMLYPILGAQAFDGSQFAA